MGSLYLKSLLGDDFELLDKDIPQEHPLSAFLGRVAHQEMRKGLPGIEDASWTESLEAAPNIEKVDEISDRAARAADAQRRTKEWLP
jgi:hypothetical protein